MGNAMRGAKSHPGDTVQAPVTKFRIMARQGKGAWHVRVVGALIWVVMAVRFLWRML
jgi:hypothetical protein